MLNISRVSVLPEVKEANTIYLVADGASGLQVVITGSTAAVIKSTRTSDSITQEITNAVNAVATGGAGDLTTAVTNLTNLINNEADARAATDTQIRSDFAAADTAIRTDFAAADTATLDAAKTYADGLNTAEAAARAAADTQIRTDFAAADAAQATTFQGLLDDLDTALNSNIDTAVASLDGSLRTFIAQQDLATLNSAKSYTDTVVGSLDLSNSAAYAADIAGRDSLAATMTKNTFVMVADATADPTVDAGAALYFRNVVANTWTKIAEYESMDIVIPNLDILADLGDSNGLLTYKGTLVATVQHTGSEW